ncbi:hypothetical protein NC652_041797 [Populus alba x Populus x berolinensis]|nr:hypothetical protein NC652_041797 [Populus alba x Populus x berolinensis]
MIYLEKEQKARQGKAWPLSLTLFFDSSKRERRGEERETYALNITDCVWLLLNLFKGNNDNSKEASPVLTSIGWVKLYTKTNAAASAELERIREIHHPVMLSQQSYLIAIMSKLNGICWRRITTRDAS